MISQMNLGGVRERLQSVVAHPTFHNQFVLEIYTAAGQRLTRTIWIAKDEETIILVWAWGRRRPRRPRSSDREGASVGWAIVAAAAARYIPGARATERRGGT
ncbi:MAG: hypothetical protein ACRDG5_09405 [Anaerolineales bacterium]